MKREDEAQRKSATRANPSSPTHVRTSFADPCFAEPEGLTISYMQSDNEIEVERCNVAESCVHASLSVSLRGKILSVRETLN